MIDSISEECLSDFTYSKKSHFDFFRDKGYDIDLYGKKLNIDEDVDLETYQNLMVYSLMNNKKGLKILQIGTRNGISFEKLQDMHECWKMDINELSKSHNDLQFVPLSTNDEIKIQNPKSYFDFIFLSSTFDTIPKDINIFDNILLNIKYLLNAKGVLLSSFINVINNSEIWFDEMFSFLTKEKKVINKMVSYSRINNDPNLLVLPEIFYNKYWQKYTNKSYKDFGKAFIYNIFIENKEKITPENFSKFTYLMKTHKDFFISNGYAEELFNKNTKKEFDLDDYNSLLIYSFIKSNFKKGDRILQIGKAPQYLENLLKVDYDFFKLENINLLMGNDNFDDNILHFNNNGNVKNLNYKNFFSFSYSMSKLEIIEDNIYKYLNIVNNIDKIMMVWGLTLFSFKFKISDNYLIYPNLLSFLFDNNVFKLNKFIKGESVLSDDELYYNKKILSKTNTSENNKRNEIKESIYNIVWKKILFLPASCKTKYHNRLKNYPVYIFHHLMKCGGTSLFFILDNWFKTIDDNIFLEDLNSYVLKKYNITIFHNDICLKAHFQRDGIYLHQRYPELLNKKDECKIFTFIRNPLSIKISKYYFLKSIKAINENVRLTESLLRENNFTANRFPCDETNYKEIIDRYFFVGIVERFQESFDLFADMIGKKKVKIPFLNISEKDSQIDELTPEFLKKFKNQNVLDYKVYEYCLEKFNKLL